MEPWRTPRVIYLYGRRACSSQSSGFDCFNTTQITLKSGFPFESTMSYVQRTLFLYFNSAQIWSNTFWILKTLTHRQDTLKDIQHQ